eukprot:1153887-Pelagomonas_calceolata.AAC.1
MEFLSKFMGPLVVQSKLFKLVQGMISVAGPTDTQKDTVESHNFSSNDFAEFQSNARAAGLHEVGGVVSRGWLMWSSVLVCVCCVTHGVSGWKKEKKEWVWHYREDLEVALRQLTITPHVHVNQACPPRAFAKSFDNHSSSNIGVQFSGFRIG